MKNNIFFLALTLLFSVSYAQENFIFSIHAVQIEGDLEAFEKVESLYMQKVAQAAVDNGDIMGWSFNKTIHLDNINDEENYNYTFIQMSPNIEMLLSEKSNWWMNTAAILSADEQKEVAELSKKFTWKKDVRVLYHTETSFWDEYDGAVAFQFNFASPKNLDGFIAENKSLWGPYFQENKAKLKMIGWGVATKIHPQGHDWSSVVTWDIFKNLADLYQYRIGVEGLTYPLEASKMAIYNPDGFEDRPIHIGLASTKN